MSALDDMIETHRLEIRQIKAANWLMYEQALEGIAKRLACPVQMAQDVLHQVSIETGRKPIDILDAVNDFLQTLATYQDKEAE
jgi:hypothetical protein